MAYDIELPVDFLETKDCQQKNCQHNDDGTCVLMDWDEEQDSTRVCFRYDLDESRCECGELLVELYDIEEYWGSSVKRYYWDCPRC